MNWPNRLTLYRIVLSPVFLVVFFLPQWTGVFSAGSVIVLWLIGILSEVSDMLDGYLARRNGEITDLGKVLDPFADVISRITYFLCFAGMKIMPIWILAVFIYRELGITFLRMLMIRKGIAMQANIWGKSKAVTYMVAGIAGMWVVTMQRTGLLIDGLDAAKIIALVIFILAAVASVGSFMTYAVRVWNELKSPHS